MLQDLRFAVRLLDQGTLVFGGGHRRPGARHRPQRHRVHAGERGADPRPAVQGFAGLYMLGLAGETRRAEQHLRCRFPGLARADEGLQRPRRLERRRHDVSDDRGMPEQARGSYLTANAFSVVGQPPLLGRDFTPEDEQRGGDRAVIIGYSIWKNRYGGDPGVIGKLTRVNGQPATIVGVMPEGMLFPQNNEIWAAFVPNGRAAAAQLARPGRVRPRRSPGSRGAQALDRVGHHCRDASRPSIRRPTRSSAGSSSRRSTNASTAGRSARSSWR